MPSIRDKVTGEEREGNNPFFQFYKHNFKMMRKVIAENSLAAELFMFLVEQMDTKNAIIVSQKALEEVLGSGRTSIYKATKYLVDNKYIQILKSGTSNVYCVNADIVWTQRADKKTYAKFDAKVYLTASEQSEEQEARIRTEFQKVASTDSEGNKQLTFLGDEFTAEVEYKEDTTGVTTHLTIHDLNALEQEELKMKYLGETNNDKQPDTWSNFSGNPDKPIDFDEERIEKLIEKVIRKIW